MAIYRNIHEIMSTIHLPETFTWSNGEKKMSRKERRKFGYEHARNFQPSIFVLGYPRRDPRCYRHVMEVAAEQVPLGSATFLCFSYFFYIILTVISTGTGTWLLHPYYGVTLDRWTPGAFWAATHYSLPTEDGINPVPSFWYKSEEERFVILVRPVPVSPFLALSTFEKIHLCSLET